MAWRSARSSSRHPQLRAAVVLSTTQDTCAAYAQGEAVVPYAAPFPRPRTERVAPGHLVALAAVPDGPELVVWRWYDAVVLGHAVGLVRLWEPAHGEVLAQPRDPRRAPAPGSRAYLSAGLPGAEWWLAGPAVSRAEDADVELDEVDHFFTSLDLWGRLT